MKTIYATHITSLTQTNCTVIFVALSEELFQQKFYVRKRWRWRDETVLIITYLSETKPCLCDDNICFENERYKLSNNNPSSVSPEDIMRDSQAVSKCTGNYIQLYYYSAIAIKQTLTFSIIGPPSTRTRKLATMIV